MGATLKSEIPHTKKYLVSKNNKILLIQINTKFKKEAKKRIRRVMKATQLNARQGERIFTKMIQ